MTTSPVEETVTDEDAAPSRTAGGCVLLVGAVIVGAILFAVSAALGILALWAAGGLGLWAAARRRQVSDLPATPPPGEDRPSCSECAGHSLISVTPLEGQKGMLIYKTAPSDRPNHTHIHLGPAA